MGDAVRTVAGWIERLRGVGQTETAFVPAGVQGLMGMGLAPIYTGKPRIARHAIDCAMVIDDEQMLAWCWACTGSAVWARRSIEYSGYGRTPAEAYRQWAAYMAGSEG